MKRTTLTVSELLGIANTAANALDLLTETPWSKLSTAARNIVGHSTRDLRGVTELCRDVIGASGQGCASDAVILTMEADDDDQVVRPYRVCYRAEHVEHGTRLDNGVHVCDATSREEAALIVERFFAGRLNVTVTSVEEVLADGTLAPSPLESSPDAAAEWGIDAQIAERAAELPSKRVRS